MPLFPSPDDISAPARERANALKDRFLAEHPSLEPKTADHRDEYGHWFRKDVLPNAPPDRLKYFANTSIGASSGNMSPFNREWNTLGEAQAASRLRGVIDYLLYGPEGTDIQDRLTNLITGKHGFGMKGFREALLTRVLCVSDPQRFLPILVYTGKAGKKEYTKRVYDLELPSPESVSWTIGRLIFRSNDLLLGLVGEGFEDTWHAAQFLYFAYGQT